MDTDRGDKSWVEHDLDNYQIQKNVCRYILSNWMFFIWGNCVLLTASLKILGKESRIYRMISHFYYSSYENFKFTCFDAIQHTHSYSILLKYLYYKFILYFLHETIINMNGCLVFSRVYGQGQVYRVGLHGDGYSTELHKSIHCQHIQSTQPILWIQWHLWRRHDNDIWWVIFLPFLIMEWWRMKIIRSKDTCIQFWRRN